MRKLGGKTLFYCLLLWCMQLHAQSLPKHSFSLGDSTFLLDGKPFQMISGEMHYTRVPREAWRQRMQMAKAMGLNTIGTYVFWNVHEPEKGQFDFSGNNDIAAFVKIAQEEGLWVVLRPSPYVCAEWEFGGYPYWLQKEAGLVVRSKEAGYLKEYRAYIQAVGKQLAPLQVNHGGNILMVQVENEYGFYGSDQSYLDLNRTIFKEAGFDGLLYTCDPPSTVRNGHLNGLLPAINGLDKPAEVKKLVRQYHDGKGPFYVSEWYPAWFDWWGTKHHTVPAAQYVSRLDTVLAAGLSINMYMFHGGTTRGFMNGANYNDKSPYEPQVSSYDYDAPLDEAGNATEKFMKFREVISKYLPKGQTLPDVPKAKPVISIPSIQFTEACSLYDLLPAPKQSSTPLSFEDLNQAYGYVLYRTTLNGGGSAVLKIDGLRDYGIVFLNGVRAGTLDRRLNQDSLALTLPEGKITLDILVENLGRINFGPYLLQNKKGIIGKVLWNNRELKGWQQFSLPFNHLNNISFAGKKLQGNLPVLRKGSFQLDKTGDTYLDMRAWGKGCVWVNGHHLGRYWEIGPQQTLYLPAEWLKKGNNEIVVLELLKPEQNSLQAIEKPILDNLQHPTADAGTDLITGIPFRKTTSLNGEWQYIIDPYETGFYDYRFKERKENDREAYWNSDIPVDKTDRKEHGYSNRYVLKVPGDWNSQDAKFLYYEGTVWYKKSFDFIKSAASNRVFLYFGAVNYKADVYLNGRKLGTHIGGFTPFNFEIPDSLLLPKGNFLVVKVDNKRGKEEVPTLNTDWWNYGGITRDVNIVEVPQNFIQDYFIQLKPAAVAQGKTEAAGWIRLNGEIGGQQAIVEIPELQVRQVVPITGALTPFSCALPGVQLWSPEHPKLYQVKISISGDSVEDRIGFRTIEAAGQQLLLNGKPVFLRGVSVHEEIPQERRRAYSKQDALQLLGWAKELGCNMVRLAHYPHDESMTRMADSLGILVWSEIPVYWTIDFNNEAVYNKAQAQLTEMITRDHNRASIIIWSVGNETPVSPVRTAFMHRLIDAGHRLDATRLLSAALEVNYNSGKQVNVIDDPLGQYVDIVAFNEYLGWYGGSPATCRTTNWSTPYNKPLFISETGAEALGGYHADSLTRWSEEYQEWYYKEQVNMLQRMPANFAGISPWILADFRSPKRNNPQFQEGWNNKGLIDQQGRKKKAFFVLRDYYNSKK